MLKERLPVHIDPLRLAKAGRHLAGTLPLAQLQRLGAALASNEGAIEVEIEFGFDQQRIPYMRGTLRGDLPLVCQRCMEQMALPVEATFNLGVVGSEAQAERLPEHYDPLLYQDEPLHLADIIEDELLLALPIVPKHPEASCPVQAGEEVGGETEAPSGPFAGLRVLKGGKQDIDNR